MKHVVCIFYVLIWIPILATSIPAAAEEFIRTRRDTREWAFENKWLEVQGENRGGSKELISYFVPSFIHSDNEQSQAEQRKKNLRLRIFLLHLTHKQIPMSQGTNKFSIFGQAKRLVKQHLLAENDIIIIQNGGNDLVYLIEKWSKINRLMLMNMLINTLILSLIICIKQSYYYLKKMLKRL